MTANILRSDGYVAQVEAKVADAWGRVWLDKQYEVETAAASYNFQRYPDHDPYQDLFNSIANDMTATRVALSDADVRNIRLIGATLESSCLRRSTVTWRLRTKGVTRSCASRRTGIRYSTVHCSSGNAKACFSRRLVCITTGWSAALALHTTPGARAHASTRWRSMS